MHERLADRRGGTVWIEGGGGFSAMVIWQDISGGNEASETIDGNKQLQLCHTIFLTIKLNCVHTTNPMGDLYQNPIISLKHHNEQ